MPNSCSAPRCRTGYYNDHSGIPIFQIPSTPPDVVHKWKRFLHRDDVDSLKNIFVCAKHFDADQIVDTQTYIDIDGQTKTRSIKPTLKKGEIPKYLPDCPNYLNDHSIKHQRLDRDKKESALQIQAIHQSIECFEQEQSKFSITTFDELIKKSSDIDVPPEWIFWHPRVTEIYFISFTSPTDISVHNYFSIDTSLQVKCFHRGILVYLSINCINDIRQISTLIREITNYRADTVEIEVKHSISSVKHSILLLEEKLNQSGSYKFPQMLPQLYFILGQLENVIVNKNRRLYNIITMILSLKSHLSSSACYNQLRNMECISLPHESSLRRMYSNFGVDVDFLACLRAETNQFNQFERHICLNMDEIHVKSTISYKGGRFIGAAECSSSSTNEVELAKTILCFMVTSLFKKWSTVVRLLPLSNPKASDLLPITQQIIKDVEQCGLIVDVIVSDNYPLNVNLFKLLGNSKELRPCVPHPIDSKRPLYLLFDFVHIIKTIRNNWINQKDYNCTFLFPHFSDISNSNFPVRLSRAPFQDLRFLFKSDQFSVAKLAPNLAYKSCWPSILERQNVKLALRIFNDKSVAALTIQQSQRDLIDRTQTDEFIALICRVWKIFNVNTPCKGIRLNDKDYLPLVENDPRFHLISTIVCWLDNWRCLPFSQGKLTAQTFTSFRHSCIALPNLVNYLTGECGFSYVLSSILQNDPIEHHFGLYRQMSGSNYHVSVCQVLESERALKLSNILKLYNRQEITRKDRSSFIEFLTTFESEKVCNNPAKNVDLTLYSPVLTFEDIELNIETRQALAFIGGYATFTLIRKLSRVSDLCSECILLLTENKFVEIEEVDSSFSLIQLLDRGGLKWPSKQVLNAVFTLWNVFTNIERYPVILKEFMNSNSRYILVQICLLKLESQGCEDWAYECIDCCTEGNAMLHSILKTISNCILNNKAKNMEFTTYYPKNSQKKILKLTSK